QLGRGHDRAARLANIDADRMGNEGGCVTLTRLEVRRRVMHPVRRVREHPVEQTLDQTELSNCSDRARAVERARVELRSKRCDVGEKRIEHQFVLYRKERRKTRETPMFQGFFKHDKNGEPTTRQVPNPLPRCDRLQPGQRSAAATVKKLRTAL